MEDYSKQIWVQTKGASVIERLLYAIKGMRNNLFHGGKFQGIYEPEYSRNYILLKHGLSVLNFWISLHRKVRISFLQDFG